MSNCPQMASFSHMERPLIVKNQWFLAVCKSSRLCHVTFYVGTSRMHSAYEVLAKFEFSPQTPKESRLNNYNIKNRIPV